MQVYTHKEMIMTLTGRPSVEQLVERYTVESGIVERKPALGLPAYACGYPIVYIDEYDNELCEGCASEFVRELANETNPDERDMVTKVTMWYLHLEGDTVFCSECNAEIESAYGPIDAD